MENGTLLLLRGLPGCGKTTLGKFLLDENTKHIEADEFFMNGDTYNFDSSKLGDAHAWCKNTVMGWMSSDTPVKKIIVSNTFTTVKEMNDYINLAKEFGYVVYSVIVENRHGGVNVHQVPEETLTRMKNRFDVKLI